MKFPAAAISARVALGIYFPRSFLEAHRDYVGGGVKRLAGDGLVVSALATEGEHEIVELAKSSAMRVAESMSAAVMRLAPGVRLLMDRRSASAL